MQALCELVRGLQHGHTSRRDEAAIIDALGAAPAPTLDDALTQLDLTSLIGDVDDRRFGPQNRAALLELLTARRIGDLSARARAGVVAGLQRGRTSTQDERAIRDVFVATSGRMLADVKRTLDDAGGYRDLHQLLYRDIDDVLIRAQILGHFEDEAARAAGVERRPVKVLSDMDDTLYVNWKDTRYPKSTVYPGVLQFYLELDRGPDELHPDRQGDITFVTARPGDRVGWVEGATRATLEQLGVRGATVLTGSFRRLIGNERLASKKLQNFIEYAAIYPEYDFVWSGDSGQADALVGERMRAALPDRVRAVFIHDVVATPESARIEWATKGVMLHDTYVGAATFAFEAGLISRAGLERVVAAAKAAMGSIAFDSLSQKKAREDEIERDVARARAAAGSSERV